MIRFTLALLLPAFAIGTIGGPAFAQASEPLPRFEALEQQQQMNEQRRLDNLEADRQRDLGNASQPGSGVSGAQRALIDQQYDRDRDRLLLEAARARALQQRERDIAGAALANMRVPAASSLVITDPERFILPAAPAGQYYARLEGRFVLVDRASELVVSVLPVQPTDPVGDVPAGPPPMPGPGLPIRRIAPTSSSVIHDYLALALPAPPAGQYYAIVEGTTVLVDGRTELAVKRVDPG